MLISIYFTDERIGDSTIRLTFNAELSSGISLHVSVALRVIMLLLNQAE